MVYGLWFVVEGLWFMVYGLWFMVYGLEFMVYGSWFMVEGLRLMQRFRGGLVFQAHRLLDHSTLGSRVITKDKEALLVQPKSGARPAGAREGGSH